MQDYWRSEILKVWFHIIDKLEDFLQDKLKLDYSLGWVFVDWDVDFSFWNNASY